MEAYKTTATPWLKRTMGGWAWDGHPWLCEPSVGDWFDVKGSREIRMVFTTKPTADAYEAIRVRPDPRLYASDGCQFKIGRTRVWVYSWLWSLVGNGLDLGRREKFWFWVETRR